LILGFYVAFSCYWNVMRVSGRWIQALGTVTTHCEVFARRENLICFHNHFLFSIAGYGRGAKCTPRQLAFTVQKLCERGIASDASTRAGTVFLAISAFRPHLAREASTSTSRIKFVLDGASIESKRRMAR
jgi:hypothetical protein